MRERTENETRKSEKAAKPGKPGKERPLNRATEGNSKRREAIKREGLDGHTVMTVRLRNAEFLEFSDQAEALGLSNNRALRIAARRIGGFLEVDGESQQALKDIARQISGIASNINQLAKIANTTNSVDHKGFLDERKKLGLELARVSDVQQQLLNVGRRRRDGMQRLEEATSNE